MTSRLCMNSEFFHCHQYAITDRTHNFLPWKGHTQKGNDKNHHTSDCYLLTMLKCPLCISAPSLSLCLSLFPQSLSSSGYSYQKCASVAYGFS